VSSRREVDVGLLKPADLALAQAGEDRRRERRALLELERREEREDLLGLEYADDRLRHLARLDLLGRIRAQPLAGPPRLVERADEVAADVVDGARREVPLLRLEELLDGGGRHLLESLRREG
jgi:hypothetical protein